MPSPARRRRRSPATILANPPAVSDRGGIFSRQRNPRKPQPIIVAILRQALIFIFCLVLLSPSSASAQGEPVQVPALIGIATTAGDGTPDLETIIRLARDQGIGALFLADRDRIALEVGLYPFHGLLSKKIERPGVLSQGMGSYLQTIAAAAERHPEILLVAGVESAPFYFWTGSLLAGNLTVNEWERHLLVYGLPRVEDFEELPVLHGPAGTRHLGRRLPPFFAFAAAGLLCLVLLRWPGWTRILGLILFVLAAILALGAHPFASSPFDPYHGTQGFAPYQFFIDDVAAKGGLAFWNHIEAREDNSRNALFSAGAQPYPEVLLGTTGYSGFADGDTGAIAVAPGGLWDQVLRDYCQGRRPRPVWTIATATAHGQLSALGDSLTVFLVPRATAANLLAALGQGNFYAVQGRYGQRGILRDFTVRAVDSGQTAGAGGELEAVTGGVMISVFVETGDSSARGAVVRLVRGGEVLETFLGMTPMAIDYLDKPAVPADRKSPISNARDTTSVKSTGKTYYRIDVSGQIGTIRSNPVFVSFRLPTAEALE